MGVPPMRRTGVSPVCFFFSCFCFFFFFFFGFCCFCCFKKKQKKRQKNTATMAVVHTGRTCLPAGRCPCYGNGGFHAHSHSRHGWR